MPNNAKYCLLIHTYIAEIKEVHENDKDQILNSGYLSGGREENRIRKSSNLLPFPLHSPYFLQSIQCFLKLVYFIICTLSPPLVCKLH